MRKRSEGAPPPAPMAPKEVPPPPPRPGQKAGKQAAQSVRVPHDPVNEQVLIAAVLVDKPTWDRLVPNVPADSFFGKGHPEAWHAFQEMHRKGLTYDPLTVQQISGGTVDVAYLEQLIRDRPAVPPNLHHHVEHLHKDRAKIEMVQGPLTELLEEVKNPLVDTEVLRHLLRNAEQKMAGFGTQQYLRTTAQVVREQSKILTRRREGQACWPFGIPDLDFYGVDEPHEDAGYPRLVPGAAPSKTTLITGISGSGKTTVSCTIAVAQAMMGRRVTFGAWETGEGPTLELCAALKLGWSRSDLMRGRYSAEQQRELEEEMERLGEWIKFFKLPFGKARAKEKHYNDKALDLVQSVLEDSRAEVFIADLMRRVLKETDPDDEEQAVYRLQAMAQEQKCHHIWLHQIRLKDVENRKDKRPTREGTKGSSVWIEVPDHVIAWHRPYLFKNVTDDRIEALILKQRDGVFPLAIEFEWFPKYGRLGRGRSIEYLRPGEDTMVDVFLEEAQPRRGRGGRRGN